MPQIGQFTRGETGFTGRVYTLTLSRELTIVTAEHSEAENAPAYRDPALPQPIRANLFRDDDAGTSWSLHWTRPRLREDRD